MADILLDTQSAPATPSAGQGLAWFDSSSKGWLQKNDAGQIQGDSMRAAVAQQTGFAADTYLVNSGLLIPSSSMIQGMVWEWKLVATKTAAGIATPIFTLRVGANQSTADASRLAITTAAQTAAADTAMITLIATCRSVAVNGVIQGLVEIRHNLAATGFANTPAGFNLVEGTSAGFDNTNLGGQFVGLSINGGTSAAWTINQVVGRMYLG